MTKLVTIILCLIATFSCSDAIGASNLDFLNKKEERRNSAWIDLRPVDDNEDWTSGTVREAPAEAEGLLARIAIARIDYSIGYSTSLLSHQGYFSLRLQTGSQSFFTAIYYDESLGRVASAYVLGWQANPWSVTASRFVERFGSVAPIVTDSIRLDYRLPDLTINAEYRVASLGKPTISVGVSNIKISSDFTVGVSVAHTGLIEATVSNGPWAVTVTLLPGGEPTYRLSTSGYFNIWSRP